MVPDDSRESRTPLLPEELPESLLKADDAFPSDKDLGQTTIELWPEVKRVLSLAIPISVSEVVSFFAYLITTAQVGHLGSLELSAMVLARSVFHITGLSLVIGMASAVETFCGQAYGARQYRACGLVLQRAALLCLLTCVIPLTLWTKAGWIMLWMGQQPEVVSPAAHYLGLLRPSLCAWAVTGCIRNYLSSQGVVSPLTLTSMLATALTPLVNHVFMFGLGWGLVGAAAAYNVLQVVELLLLLASMIWLHLCRQKTGSQTWGGFRKEAWSGWGEYLRIALPSGAAICLDWWTYEAVILIAGLLPDAHVQLGAMGLAFDTHALLFMIIGGFASAASTRVSNELGAGRDAAARTASLVCLALGLAAPLAASGGLLSAPRAWARLYTPDGAIVELVARLMPVLTVSNLADALVAVASGVLRGSGRQELAFKVNLAVYWLLGLPCASVLALRFNMGALGLWLAMGGASALQALILVCGLLRFDWPLEARKALRRVAAGEEQAGEGGGAGIGIFEDAGAAGGAVLGPLAPGIVNDDDDLVAAERGEGSGGVPVAAHTAHPHRHPPGPEVAIPTPAPHVMLPGGWDSRHGTHEPLLGAEHAM